MRNCDVCIGIGRGDWEFEVSDVREVTLVTESHCLECGSAMPAGTTAQECNYSTPKDDYDSAEFDDRDDVDEMEPPDFHYTCLACASIRTAYSCEEGEMFGSLWESLGEVEEEIKMAGECWEQLGAAGKAKLLTKWREWKGIA